VNLENNCIFGKIIICPENFLYIWKHFVCEVLATALSIHLFKTGEGLLHACISSCIQYYLCRALKIQLTTMYIFKCFLLLPFPCIFAAQVRAQRIDISNICYDSSLKGKCQTHSFLLEHHWRHMHMIHCFAMTYIRVCAAK
jgi:hypothetical protein